MLSYYTFFNRIFFFLLFGWLLHLSFGLVLCVKRNGYVGQRNANILIVVSTNNFWLRKQATDLKKTNENKRRMRTRVTRKRQTEKKRKATTAINRKKKTDLSLLIHCFEVLSLRMRNINWCVSIRMRF